MWVGLVEQGVGGREKGRKEEDGDDEERGKKEKRCLFNWYFCLLIICVFWGVRLKAKGERGTE